MNTNHWKTIAIAIFLCAFPIIGLSIAQSPRKANETTSYKSYHETRILYAQAFLDLMKHELNVSEEVRSSLSDNALEQCRKNVKFAEEQLRVAKLPINEADTAAVRLRYAEENAETAKREYERAISFVRENRFAYTDAQIERLRLKAEVAKHRLSVMSNPVHLMSLLDHMHWEIDRLNEDIMTLQGRLEQMEKR